MPAPPASAPARTDLYFVFARKKADEPLTAVGELTAESKDAVAAAAQSQFGAEWLELVAVPASAASWAIREEA